MSAPRGFSRFGRTGFGETRRAKNATGEKVPAKQFRGNGPAKKTGLKNRKSAAIGRGSENIRRPVDKRGGNPTRPWRGRNFPARRATKGAKFFLGPEKSKISGRRPAKENNNSTGRPP
jgi:hypothetical protein